MGRPKTGVDNRAEKALTRVICGEVFLASGLTMAELESVFLIGTSDAFGRKTSKTFSRYVEADPSKSRAAPRDVLHRIVKTSLKRGWLENEQISRWGVSRVLMLDHIRASEIFEQRKNERDDLVRTLRELRMVAKKAHDVISRSKSIQATLYSKDVDVDVGIEAEVWKVHAYVRTRPEFIRENFENSEDCPISSLPDFVAPVDLNGVLQLLEVCLEQTRIQFNDGVRAVPVPDLKRLTPKSRSQTAESDFSNLDELLALVQKEMT